MADENGLMGLLMDRVSEFTETASVHGPFFFGVFLIIVSMIVMYRRDNRNMSIFYAVSGIVFMGLSSFIFMETRSGEKIYPYIITLTNLPKHADIHLPYNDQPMYRDNISTSLAYSSVQVAILSNIKLERSKNFSVELFTSILDANGNLTSHKQNVGRLVVPFNGKPVSGYKLQTVNDQNSSFEEDGDISAAILFMFVEDVAQNSAQNSTLLARIGSVFVSSAVAADQDNSNAANGTFSPALPPLVVYYQKEADGSAIINAIKSIEIQSIIKPSKLADAANAIWVGIDVSSETIGTIAKSIMNQNIPIKHIGHFDSIDTKTNIIQIGTSKRSDMKDPITVEALADFIILHEDQQTKKSEDRQTILEKAIKLDEDVSRILKKQAY